MTGIYSSPVQYPTQPENGMRARNGERPLCWNREHYPGRVQVMGLPGHPGFEYEWSEPRPTPAGGKGVQS